MGKSQVRSFGREQSRWSKIWSVEKKLLAGAATVADWVAPKPVSIPIDLLSRAAEAWG